MDKVRQAIEENRIIFFNNGRYKYVPSKEYQKEKEKEKRFDSEKANKIHNLKVMYRKSLWQETDRKLFLIEKYMEKGLKRISNKEFIFK